MPRARKGSDVATAGSPTAIDPLEESSFILSGLERDIRHYFRAKCKRHKFEPCPGCPRHDCHRVRGILCLLSMRFSFEARIRQAARDAERLEAEGPFEIIPGRRNGRQREAAQGLSAAIEAAQDAFGMARRGDYD